MVSAADLAFDSVKRKKWARRHNKTSPDTKADQDQTFDAGKPNKSTKGSSYTCDVPSNQ